jgi:hypothetical protein
MLHRGGLVSCATLVLRSVDARAMKKKNYSRLLFLRVPSCPFVDHFLPFAERAQRSKNPHEAQKMIDVKILQLYILHSRKEVSHHGKEESR